MRWIIQWALTTFKRTFQMIYRKNGLKGVYLICSWFILPDREDDFHNNPGFV